MDIIYLVFTCISIETKVSKDVRSLDCITESKFQCSERVLLEQKNCQRDIISLICRLWMMYEHGSGISDSCCTCMYSAIAIRFMICSFSSERLWLIPDSAGARIACRKRKLCA